MARWTRVTAFSFCLILFSCSASEQSNDVDTTHPDDNVRRLDGKRLSKQYCQSCHLYPEPSLLDKNTWERSVLPLMGRRLGIYEENVPRSSILNGAIDKDRVIRLDMFPERQLVDQDDWQKIREYYISAAPEALPSGKHLPMTSTPLTRFEVIIPSYQSPTPLTTMVKIDAKNGTVYVGGSKNKSATLTMLDTNFKVTDRVRLPSAPVDIAIGDGALTLTLVGALVLQPANNLKGQVLHIFRRPDEKKYSLSRDFVEDLTRPLQTVFDDVNGDGQDDILIADFGYYTGALNLYESSLQNKGAFRKNVLKNEAGAIRVLVQDMDHDGKKDITALFAQGNEGISIFYNKGNGKFNEERILQFNPAYGSVYFEFADMNSDGHPDILFSNGDNGDYPPILKNYHGVRIFENNGENQFHEVYFFPMHGAYRSSAADFDLDGDLDIMAISYFPDRTAPSRQDLVYLRNDGNYSFSAETLNEEIPGRWLTFDIADIDQDGYKDVLIGGAGTDSYASPGGKATVGKDPSLVLLKNVGKR